MEEAGEFNKKKHDSIRKFWKEANEFQRFRERLGTKKNWVCRKVAKDSVGDADKTMVISGQQDQDNAKKR